MKNGSYQGYNIGIKVESFLKEIDKNLPKSSNVSIYYGKVLYFKKEQQNEIENLLQTLETSLMRSSETSYMKNLADWALKRYIDLYGVFYKHNKFAGEQEYRFVIEFDDDSNDIGKDLGILNADDCNIKENFCVRNGIITPFLEVPFANDTISRVYISPMTEFEIAKFSIRELIDQKVNKLVYINLIFRLDIKNLNSLRRQSQIATAALIVHILRLKKDENYGIIRYRNSGGNYAYLHIHIKREIRLG